MSAPPLICCWCAAAVAPPVVRSSCGRVGSRVGGAGCGVCVGAGGGREGLEGGIAGSILSMSRIIKKGKKYKKERPQRFAEIVRRSMFRVQL